MYSTWLHFRPRSPSPISRLHLLSFSPRGYTQARDDPLRSSNLVFRIYTARSGVLWRLSAPTTSVIRFTDATLFFYVGFVDCDGAIRGTTGVCAALLGYRFIQATKTFYHTITMPSISSSWYQSPSPPVCWQAAFFVSNAPS